jgi:hypothetical protein
MIRSRLMRVAASGAAAALLSTGAASAASASTGTSTGRASTTSASAGWSADSLPLPSGSTGGALQSVSCVSGGTCVATGDYGVTTADSKFEQEPYAVIKTPGKGWKIMTVPLPTGDTAGDLVGVSCTSASFCLAAGDENSAGYAFSETWNGTSWSTESVPTPSGGATPQFSGVSCTSPTACMAVGDYPSSNGELEYNLAESWNGTSWTVVPTASEPNVQADALNAVSCASASSCMAVGINFESTGTNPMVAESWNGSTWTNTTVKVPVGKSFSQLLSVSCPTASVCTAVGSKTVTNPTDDVTGLAERWNGTTWTLQTVPAVSGVNITLGGVSCPTTAFCLAAGGPTAAAPAPGAETWTTAGGWSAQTLAPPAHAVSSGLADISCLSATTCTGVGHYQRVQGTKGASGVLAEQD